MIIVSQNRDLMLNFDNINYIQCIGNKIICSTMSMLREVGEYNTTKRASDVLDELCHNLHHAIYYLPSD